MLQASTTTKPSGAIAIACAPTYTDRSNARKGLKRAAERAGRSPDEYEITGQAPSFSFRLKIADGIPDFLLVKNRKPLTAEQQRKVDAAFAKAKPHPEAARDPRLPKSIDAVGLALLAQNRDAERTKTRDRLVKAGFIKESDMSKKAKTKGAKSAKKATSGAGTNKGEAVVKMLKARWTPMDDIVKETGWLAPSARAFISRLRTVDKVDVQMEKRDGKSCYRIA